MATGENTIGAWRGLAAAGCAASEFAARLNAQTETSRRAAIAWTEANPDAAFSHAKEGPLQGVPFLVKDLFEVAGVPTRAGSTFLENERPVPTADSALVTRFRELGAVLVAKTHMNEFAYGATGENSHHGDCYQSTNPGRLTGGSSSGSAWGVQAGIAPLALGTDTGCSTRLPAAFCGLWSMRLAPGHWTITDVLPLAPSFDTAGWFTSNAADMAETLSLVLGLKPGTHSQPGAWISLADLGETEPEMDAALAAVAGRIARPASSRVMRLFREVHERAPAAYAVIVAREALRVHRPFLERHAADYDPVVLSRLKRALEFTESDEATARATNSAVEKLMRDAVAGAGFVAMPVSPVPALTKDQCDDAHRARILRLNAPASVAGLPTLTIPVPLPGGLSGGVQIIYDGAESSVPLSVLRMLG